MRRLLRQQKALWDVAVEAEGVLGGEGHEAAEVQEEQPLAWWCSPERGVCARAFVRVMQQGVGMVVWPCSGGCHLFVEVAVCVNLGHRQADAVFDACWQVQISNSTRNRRQVWDAYDTSASRAPKKLLTFGCSMPMFGTGDYDNRIPQWLECVVTL